MPNLTFSNQLLEEWPGNTWWSLLTKMVIVGHQSKKQQQQFVGDLNFTQSTSSEFPSNNIASCMMGAKTRSQIQSKVLTWGGGAAEPPYCPNMSRVAALPSTISRVSALKIIALFNYSMQVTSVTMSDWFKRNLWDNYLKHCKICPCICKNIAHSKILNELFWFMKFI